MCELELSSNNIENEINERGEVMACTSGVSMYPMLRHRKDMVIIKKAEFPLKKYDVPLYRLKSGKLVLHRILKVTPECYIIRGDNLLDKEYVTEDMIIGVLKGFSRGGKYCDCAKNFGYKVYIRINRYSFYIRKLWKKVVRPALSRIKHIIIK